MAVQEKIERLKRAKTTHSTEEMDRLGWARYEEIRGSLEAQHHGEVDTGFSGFLCLAEQHNAGEEIVLIATQ